MPSQKLPLFGGLIWPLHNGSILPLVAPVPNVIAGPPDKSLSPAGVQAIYEIHLWLITGSDGAQQAYWLYAIEDSAPAVTRTIWSGNLAQLGVNARNEPIKILDGYPIRGNVSLGMLALFATGLDDVGDEYPTGAQVFGYAYRVGQGTVKESERRFIGEPSSDNGLSVGLPLVISPGGKETVHTFESGRVDEVSLAFTRDTNNPPDGNDPAGTIKILFEDANNQPIIAGHEVLINLQPQGQNYLRDPQSVYAIKQAAFGSTVYALDHIAVETLAQPDKDLYVHGYFHRQ